jgi:hypothetical protein
MLGATFTIVCNSIQATSKQKVHAKSTSRFLHNFDEHENEVGSIFEKYIASCTIHCIVK